MSPNAAFVVALLAATSSSAAAFMPLHKTTHVSRRAVRTITGVDDELGAASGEFPHDVMEHAVEKLKKTISDTINKEELTKMSIADVAESTVGIVENAIEYVEERMLALERELASIHAEILDVIEERRSIVAMKEQSKEDSKAAEDRAMAVESYDTFADDLERRRDMAVSHAARHLLEGTTHLLYVNKAELRREVKREKRILEEMGQLKKNRAELGAVLEELRSMIRAKTSEAEPILYAPLDEFGKKPLKARPVKTDRYEYAMLDEFGKNPLEGQSKEQEDSHLNFELMDEFGGY